MVKVKNSSTRAELSYSLTMNGTVLGERVPNQAPTKWYRGYGRTSVSQRRTGQAVESSLRQVCRKAESDHQKANHEYRRDSSLPEWHGWHAARRGLGSNLYRLGVPEMVIQRILRHANVSTTATYYIKTAADDVRNAMAMLENRIAESGQTQTDTDGTLNEQPGSVPNRIQ